LQNHQYLKGDLTILIAVVGVARVANFLLSDTLPLLLAGTHNAPAAIRASL
jgi:hypothetical protein